ncbi:MAG: hypothetical protein JNK02_06145 [Planctomycetes bacterium]|nr:hypothetical protein [Planctomycetota bacterium]
MPTLRGFLARIVPSAFVCALGSAGASALSGGAGCGASEWIPTFGGSPGMSDQVHALQTFDAGSGPELYAGGTFLVAGGTTVNYIARWDGFAWNALAGGVGAPTFGPVFALTVHDDGSGPALYVGGAFTTAGGLPTGGLARWDGSSWSSVGGTVNGNVRAFAVFDDGSGGGPALFVGGSFANAGNSGAQYIAKWNGSTWSSVPGYISGTVHSLAVHDDGLGGGPALYAGGYFSAGLFARHVARWTGTTWAPLGSLPNNAIYALASHDDGNGSQLYAGGAFVSIGGTSAYNIARWNGAAWAPLGSGFSGPVWALASHDDGSGGGASLFAAGDFPESGGVAMNDVARWNGSSWSSLAGGLGGGLEGASALAVHDDGFGARLLVGGAFTSAGGVPTARIARWNGMDWSALGSGLNGEVNCLLVFDDGGGPQLVVGGDFISPGGAPSRRIARWNGLGWSALGAFAFPVRSLVLFDDGTGPALHAGGLGVWRWNGASWDPLPSIPGSTVYALAVYDDGSGPALYAGGNASGAGPVWKRTGSSWVPVAGAFAFTTVRALTVFDDGLGGGPELYAGGDLPGRLQKWDGATWTIVGGGLAGSGAVVRALEVHDEGLGGGPALFVGGTFTSAGPVAASGVVRWNGSTWSPTGTGFHNAPFAGSVHALRSFTDPANGSISLVAGGTFTTTDGTAAANLARWNGSNWSALGSGASAAVRALASYDAGSGAGPRLFAGGAFTSVPDSGDAYLGVFGCSNAPAISAFCFGDGTGTACPCANLGAAGHGCANSIVAAGARLTATGSASIASDTVVLSASGMPNSSALYFQGNAALAGGAGEVFGDGLRCATTGIVRLGTLSNVGGASTYPGSGDPALHVRGGVSAPATRLYQCWYRNAAAYCTPSGFNLTNGVAIAWGP